MTDTNQTMTNLQKLPLLHAALAQHEAALSDITAAFNDKVNAMRDAADPTTGKSVADMIKAEKKKIASLEVEILTAWKFPDQVNMDLGGA